MGLDLWFRQDVARILAATWETMQCTADGTWRTPQNSSDDRLARAYERGFEDALRAVGVAFGLAGSRSRMPSGGATLAEGYERECSRRPSAGVMSELD